MSTTIAYTLLATLFVSAPDIVVPLLDHSTRLDLIDLYEAGLTAQGGNRYGGVSEMSEMSDSIIYLRLTEVSQLEMRLLPDSIVEVTHRVKTPEKEVLTTNRYDAHWQVIGSTGSGRTKPPDKQ